MRRLVRLKANKEEGWPEQFGYIDEMPKRDSRGLQYTCVVVVLDQKYRDGKDDDGLREVTMDQVEVLR